jgi:4,5-dihydroxyphthalate decarboxylase
MANPKLRLGFREPEVDTNRPLVDGTVKVEGFDLEISDFDDPEFIDAWDASFGGLMQTKGRGDHPYISIPAYPNRKFRLSYIFVNSASGIESPKDLEGKRVFVSSTAGVWARGALQNYYGVDLTRVSWCMPGREAKSWSPDIAVEALPHISGPLAAVAIDSMLLNKEVDAVIEPNVLPSISKRDPRVHRLFRDYKTEEQNYFKATGIFPISHMVTLKQDFVAKHPEAPVALLKAYRQARDVALDRLYGSDPEILITSWVAAAIDEQREIMGDNYWSYNIKDNVRSLEAMMVFAHQFGLTPKRLEYESFFHPEAAALEGV